MTEKIFKSTGNWYKGNIHAHTTNSDGNWTPEQTVKEYMAQGYSFLCLSEHDYYTDLRSELETDAFILLPGLEASIYLLDTSNTTIDVEILTGGQGYRKMSRPDLVRLFQEHPGIERIKTHHIHGILGNEAMQSAAGDKCFSENEHTLVPVYFDTWDGVKAAEEMSDYLKARGCFTTYNHPIWSRVDTDDVRDAKGFWAMEVYNYATVNECGEGEDTTFWDAMLRRNNAIMAFASDDNHNGGTYPESFGGYIMVQAEVLTHEAIVNSMLEGRYYSSSGAEIFQWGIKDGKVYVECAPAKRISFICGGRVGASKAVVAQEGKMLTYAECPLQGNETYVRIEVADINEKHAWTNVVML